MMTADERIRAELKVCRRNVIDFRRDSTSESLGEMRMRSAEAVEEKYIDRIKALSRKEYAIVRWYFFYAIPDSRISTILGASLDGIRKCRKRAIEKMSEM